MRCANCDALIPESGKFCIDCGTPVSQAATGATERLPDHAGGPLCAACGTRNPPGAAFCVTCGRALAAPFAEPPASTPPPMPDLAALTPATPVSPQPRRRGYNVAWGGVTGGLWLIGIAVLAATDWWWPGILVLVGLSSLFSGFMSGNSWQRWGGVQGAIWMFGIAIIASFGWWWPGILVLVGLSAILGAISRNSA